MKILPQNKSCFLKHSLKYSVSLMTLAVVIFSSSKLAYAEQNKKQTNGKKMSDFPIDFIADELIHDKVHNQISAKGNVEFHSHNNTLKADNVIFLQQDNIVKATGNIVLLEENGNVVFADYLELTGDFKKGFIENIKIILSDSSRLAANKITRENRKNTLEYGVFSPCDICKENPDKPPIWSIKAVRVIHDEEKQDIIYRNAWLEIGSFPVFYTPYFTHPSPEVERRSGFLAPKVSGRKNLGASIETPYLFNISPSEDFTFSPQFTTKENIVLKGEHRKIYDYAESRIGGSLTNDSNGDIKSNIDLFARKEINDYYVVETNITRAADDTYLKRYGLKGQDNRWLESNVKLEGFDNRSYTSSKAIIFQDLRETVNNNSTPMVLEPLNFNLINEPSNYGAYTSLQGSSAIIDRSQGVKSRRASLAASWHLPYTSPYGDIYHLSATIRGDAYNVENVPLDNSEYSGSLARMFPELALEWRYPLARREKASYQVIEPIIVGVISPSNINKTKIPNEDSRDLELDDTNILDTNHFIGYDRVETGARINYGIKWSAYGQTTGRASGFLGQSYRFSKESYFPRESGLDKHFTDYVGRIQANPNDFFKLMYSFRLDQNSLEARRNQFDITAGTPVFKVNSDYTFINSSEFSDLANRKEVGLKLSSELTRYWNANVYHRHDLTRSGGTINYGASLIYDDECFTVDTNFKRDYTSDRDYKGGFSFGITLYFKPLGKVQTGQ